MPRADLVVVNSTSGRGLSLRAVGNSSTGSWRSAVTQSFNAGQDVVLVDSTTYNTLMDNAKKVLAATKSARKEDIRQSATRVRSSPKRSLKGLDKKSKLRRKSAKR